MRSRTRPALPRSARRRQPIRAHRRAQPLPERPAPASAGIDSQNAQRAADSRVCPMAIPATMHIPDREIPGNTARHWAIPIASERRSSSEPGDAASSDRRNRHSAPAIMPPVASRNAPAVVASRSSSRNVSYNSPPTSTIGIVPMTPNQIRRRGLSPSTVPSSARSPLRTPQTSRRNTNRTAPKRPDVDRNVKVESGIFPT